MGIFVFILRLETLRTKKTIGQIAWRKEVTKNYDNLRSTYEDKREEK